MNWLAVVGSVLTAICSLIGVYVSNRKSAAIMEYRLKALEDRVNKHNTMIERTYVLEGQMKEVQHDICDLKGRIA